MKAKQGKDIALPLAYGVGTILIVSLILAAAASALVGRGTVPVNVIPACVIAGISGLLGGILCGKKAERARLPLCLAAGLLYLILAFVLRGVFFHTAAEGWWRIPLCLLPATAVGAILTSAGRRR